MALYFDYFDDPQIAPVNAITLFDCICWYIWKARSVGVFDDIWPNLDYVVSKVVALSVEVFSASSNFSLPRWYARCPGPSLPSRKAPCPEFVKLNYDDALMVN